MKILSSLIHLQFIQNLYDLLQKQYFHNKFLTFFILQYLGDRVSERVKTKVIELLYSWSVALPDEAKITEAYQMLKKQGAFITNINICIYMNLTYLFSVFQFYYTVLFNLCHILS